MIEYFRCKKIDIKPILSAFRIDTYTPSGFNYDFMNWAYNIEIEDNEIVVVNKTFRDYYTNYVLTPTFQEQVNNLSGSQTIFNTTHPIKQLLSFIINGNDRTDKVTFTGDTITYSPTGGTFPYVIQSTDTVIINYLYES